MKTSMSLRSELLQKIVEWSYSSSDIQALALVGSSARGDHPADEWSDIDLVMITLNPDHYLQSIDWLPAICDPWITTVERDAMGNIVERRVLFQNGIDVDFIVLSGDRLQAFLEEPLSSIIGRGMRVLVDKGDILSSLRVDRPNGNQCLPPSQAEFSELVNDFWFHTVWTAKKIKRGELWTAKSCCDVYMKRLLLTMIEWHTHSLEDGRNETWYHGRFIEQWASTSVVERLRVVFAHYDEADICKALLNSMALFDQLGIETARQFNYLYPDDEAKSITEWLNTLF
jgi:aminoglycoside 6-adenylyltransferase